MCVRLIDAKGVRGASQGSCKAFQIIQASVLIFHAPAYTQFLALLYLWSVNENGDYSAFFKHPTNASIIQKAFGLMERSMIIYDKDRSRKLSLQELNAFFGEQLPTAITTGAYQKALDNVFPKEEREVSELL